jgi:Na+-transporting NADH:ubiquinone oxidoreductase subunit C
LLALPNDSRTKTVLIAFLVSAVCAVLVSGATVVLRPIQAANRAAEEQARIEALVQGIPGMGDLLTQSGGTLSTVVVDLDTGRAARTASRRLARDGAERSGNWTRARRQNRISPGSASGPISRRSSCCARDDISLLLLPLSGQGYGGRIDAILALRGDTNTIAGLAVTRHSETPGLGGRIEEAAWQAGFPGTLLRDADGEMRFRVARGPASGVHEVDGITGATRTGRGVTQMVRFWLGPDGYGPFSTPSGAGSSERWPAQPTSGAS